MLNPLNRKERRALAKIKPEDIKIGSKAEALWAEVKTKTEQVIEAYEKELIVNRAILKLALDNIEKEQQMFKGGD